jgi:hypothetical protein
MSYITRYLDQEINSKNKDRVENKVEDSTSTEKSVKDLKEVSNDLAIFVMIIIICVLVFHILKIYFKLRRQ